MKKVGQTTLSISSRFLKRSIIKLPNNLPACSRAISRIDLKEEIKSKQQGLYLEARYIAGPEPIDLPYIII